MPRIASLHTDYADLSPSPNGQPLNGPSPLWGNPAGEGYIQTLLERFEERHGVDVTRELVFIMNEAKWTTGWKGFGRLALEVLG